MLLLLLKVCITLLVVGVILYVQQPKYYSTPPIRYTLGTVGFYMILFGGLLSLLLTVVVVLSFVWSLS
jgi:hypothetical protein